ncbi:mechanosensitive ion channel family protein [Lunatibacter salilacus]|uniref:mechanosensitive ion channel family protein n=1 Tax=Lunatibacter salilacus TaxID=2483804 RepID=UPI00131DF458|nr:mechanosensitive ion channel family protein [Lunatibacter salilacus]
MEDKELEEIKKDEKVQRALYENAINLPKDSSETLKREAPILGATAILFVGCGVFYFLLAKDYLPIPANYIPTVQRVVLAVMFVSLVLTANRLLKKIVNRKVGNETTVFNFNRITDLFAGILVFFIVLSLLFANWYAAMVSFGIVSLILGLALQNPLTSFFGWIYLLIRKPYDVGDRIRIGNVYGDVINVSYIDTTLWEFNGDYLSGDHPSGRIIRFANSKVFNEYIYNYSWPLFPFIWNELNFYLSHGSDFKFVTDTVQRIAEREIGKAMVRRVARFKKILAETPVDALDVNEYPAVILRAHSNTWIEVTLRYLVEPKKSGQVRGKLVEVIMAELKKYPDKAIFPTNK